MRLHAVLVATLLLLFFAAGSAAAEEATRAVLVLDRGAEARQGSASDAGNVLRLWRTLEARGVDTALLAAGVGSDGDTDLRALSPTRAALAALDEDPATSFRGATDARAALAHVLDDGVEGAVDVILVGPWSEVPPGKAAAYAATIKRWNARAPAGSRILAIGDGPGREALAGARGWAGDGRVVIGFEAPTAKTADYSPLPAADGSETLLEARLRVLGDVLWMGTPPEDTATRGRAVLTLTSDVTEDRIQPKVLAGLHTWEIRRRAQDGRLATVTFRRVEDSSVRWLAPPPEPLTFRWDKLRADARLLGPQGEAAPVFTAVDAEADRPVSRSFRLLRTLSGRAPAWRVSMADGNLPPGLEVRVGSEVPTSDEVAESEVRVTFTAQPGRPVAASGVLTLSADGMPEVLELPYEVRVQPGRFTWEVKGVPAALPPASEDPRSWITVHRSSSNAPPSAWLHATCDGGQEPYLAARVHTPGRGVATWNLTERHLLQADVDHRIEFVLVSEPPVEVPWPCTVTLALASIEGVEIEAEPFDVRVRRRQPKLELSEPLPEFRLDGQTLISDEPAVLTLDADGGDGEWLVNLLETTPVVRVGGDAPIGWQAVPRGAGVWHVVPAGRWTGPEPGVFEDDALGIQLTFEWPVGAVPAGAEVPVRVPARWGRKGFLLIGLASLALMLAAAVMGWMRTPPVKGTLLYTIDGLGGTVGRLDLSPVKRRTKPITSDANGKLSVDGDGEAIGKVRPTRVGGMFEYTDAEGERERRLLVDGMSLRLPRHLVRYVSGRAQESAATQVPTDVPDLLGPEYDIESGRIDALDDDLPDARS